MNEVSSAKTKKKLRGKRKNSKLSGEEEKQIFFLNEIKRTKRSPFCLRPVEFHEYINKQILENLFKHNIKCKRK